MCPFIQNVQQNVVTCEDFLYIMADAKNIDLGQYDKDTSNFVLWALWYTARE